MLIVVGTIIHAFSLASSSFVEEEHQTYYFFTSSLVFTLMLNTIKRHDLSRAGRLIGCLVLLRISRSWNQTGDKWINEPDVRLWLNAPNNEHMMTVSSIIAILGIYLWNARYSQLIPLQRTALFFGLTSVLAYRAATGDISLPYPQSK